MDYYFVVPLHQLNLSRELDIAAVTLYGVVALTAAVLVAWAAGALRRAEESTSQLARMHDLARRSPCRSASRTSRARSSLVGWRSSTPPRRR